MKEYKAYVNGFCFRGKTYAWIIYIDSEGRKSFPWKGKRFFSLLKKGLHSTFKIYESTFLKIKL